MDITRHDQGAPGRRPDGDPGELPARRVRRRTRTTRPTRPGACSPTTGPTSNHDGRLWTDENGNGVVNHADMTDQLQHRRLPRHRLRQVGDGAGRVRAVHVPPARRERAAWSFVARSGAARWPTACSSASSTRRRTPAIDRTHFTIQIDFYKNIDWSWLTRRRATASGHVHGEDRRAGRHAVRHVRRRDRRCRTAADSMVVPVAVAVAATAAQDATRQHHRRRSRSAAPTSRPRRRTRSTTTARSSAPTTGRGGPSPATGGSSTSTCRRRRRTGTLFLADTTWDDAGAVHRPRHADLRAGRRTLPARSADRPVRGAVHPRHGRQEPEHQHRRRRVAVRHRDRRRARTSSTAPAQEGLHALVAAPGRLAPATSSTCRSRPRSAARR